MNGRPWTTQEDDYIREHWLSKPDTEVANKLNRSVDAVRARRQTIGLRRGNTLKADIVKAKSGPCKGCIYCGRLKDCEYFIKTGARRPCKAGEGCTVKVIGKREPSDTDFGLCENIPHGGNYLSER